MGQFFGFFWSLLLHFIFPARFLRPTEKNQQICGLTVRGWQDRPTGQFLKMESSSLASCEHLPPILAIWLLDCRGKRRVWLNAVSRQSPHLNTVVHS